MAAKTINEAMADVRKARSWPDADALVRSSEEDFNAAEEAAHGDKAVPYKDQVRAIFGALGAEVNADTKTLGVIFLALIEGAHPDADRALRTGLVRAMDARPQSEKTPQSRTIARLVIQHEDTENLRRLVECFVTDGPGMKRPAGATNRPILKSVETSVEGNAMQVDTPQEKPAMGDEATENMITSVPLVTEVVGQERPGEAIVEAAPEANEIVGVTPVRKPAFILRRGDGSVTFHEPETGNPVAGYQGVAVDSAGGGSNYYGVNRDDKGEATLVPLSKDVAEEALKIGQMGPFLAAQSRAQEAEEGEITGGDKAAVAPKREGQTVVVLAGLQLMRDEQNNYRRVGEDVIAMTDKGNTIKLNESKVDLVKAGLALAVEKGWSEIEIKGSKDFCSNMWVQATLAGLKTKGYEPTAQDIVAVDAARTVVVSTEEIAASRTTLIDRCLEKNVGTTDANLDNNGPRTWRGEVMDETQHHFAQNLGKGHYAIHEKRPETSVKVGQKVEVKYSDGVQVGVVDVAPKVKGKAAVHER